MLANTVVRQRNIYLKPDFRIGLTTKNYTKIRKKNKTEEQKTYTRKHEHLGGLSTSRDLQFMASEEGCPCESASSFFDRDSNVYGINLCFHLPSI